VERFEAWEIGRDSSRTFSAGWTGRFISLYTQPLTAIIFAIILDVIYQLRGLSREAPAATLLLAVAPYLVVCGPIDRLARLRKKQ
jgi:hypothetical protein